MLKSLLLLSCIIVGLGRICPPSCDPPKTQRGCQTYARNADCSQDVRDISSSEAQCGCLWQTYIQTIEPEARIIFTNDGNRCYTWAAEVCSYLEETERAVLRQNNLEKSKPEPREFHARNSIGELLERIERLESTHFGVAKHRRRNGVETISRELEKVLEKEKKDVLNANTKHEHTSQDFIGNPKQSKSAAWIEAMPEQNLEPGSANTSENKNATSTQHIYHVKQHWVDIDMPVDKFKLSVFMIILLLNILFVVVLIFCRGSGNSDKRTDTKPTGDLDRGVYWPNSGGRNGSGHTTQKSQLWNFMDKFKRSDSNKTKNRDTYSPFLHMEPIGKSDYISGGNEFSNVRTSSPYVNAGMYQSPKKTSRGLYETIDEETDFLDHTYEDPLPQPSRNSDIKDYHQRKYRW